MSSILYDHRGQPIASPELRNRAEALLKDYVAKHKSEFQDWVREHGLLRPPIYFDTDRLEWVWNDQARVVQGV